MPVREPVVAGTFYQAGAAACRRDCQALFAEAMAGLDAAEGPGRHLPERIVGGIVPHAGWIYSGEPAARTLEAIARGRTPATFVIFGAMHLARGREGLLFGSGGWRTPLGDVDVDEPLAATLAAATDLIVASAAAHLEERSIEVQVPLIRHRFPAAKIVPILVPPSGVAHEIGAAVGKAIRSAGADAVVLGSTDLTHYGPRFPFTPRGLGPAALRWAKEVNDAGVIRLVETLAAERVVAETEKNSNACGGGAVAATLAAAAAMGATRGVVLEHVTSYEVMLKRFGERSDDAVGYLSAVLG
ncbi:MAG: AmmeMemoRadiSam system protein B [Phycisphaerae bacterium]|nr:AmmeMemoRadiSam system protein B [Phycisphaerae bacterium]